MKKIKILSTGILVVLITLSSIAQDFGTAIILDSKEYSGNKYQRTLIESFHNSIVGHKVQNFNLYHWNGEAEKEVSLAGRHNPNGVIDHPITKTLYVKINLKVNDKSTPSYKRDTTGAITAMFLNYEISVRPVYKIVDLPTLEVIRSQYHKSNYKLKQNIQVTDFKKYFGSKDPEKLKSSNSKGYKLIMSNLRQVYDKKIKEYLLEKSREIGKNLGSLGGTLKSLNDKRTWKQVEVKNNEKGKLEGIVIDATAKENISKYEGIDVYSLADFGSFKHYDKIALMTVKEVSEGQVLLKPTIVGKGSLKKSLANQDKLIFARNLDLIKSLNSKGEPLKRVSIKGECFTCTSTLEEKIVSVAALKLIERNFDGPRKFFTNQYTDEKFIDFNIGEIQDKAEGIEYIFESSTAGLKATEVATGKVAAMQKKETKGLLKLMGYQHTIPELINVCLDIFDSKIEVIKTVKEKKGKTQKVLAYNPFSFESIGRLSVVVMQEEKVGGRMIARKEEIGSAYVSENISNTICELKINKGEKALFEALQAGRDVRFFAAF